MTASNHALTGALVAVVVKQPLLALPLALLMHFVMDAIPHFGVAGASDTLKKHSQPLFLTVLKADVAFSALLLIVVPILLSTEVSWLVVFGCMVACMSPDLVWGWRFYFEKRDKKISAKGLFSRFHKYIQWRETQRGFLVELAWFAAIGSLIFIRQS